MQNINKSDFAYHQGWRDLQVLTLTHEEEVFMSRKGIVYLKETCPECTNKMCIAQGEKFCPRCGYTSSKR